MTPVLYYSYRTNPTERECFVCSRTLIAINRHIFTHISSPKRVKLLNNKTTCQQMSPRSPAMSTPCHLLPSPVIARLGITSSSCCCCSLPATSLHYWNSPRMPTTLMQGETMMQIIIVPQRPPSRRWTTLIRGQGRRITFIALISRHCAPVCPHPTVDNISGRSYLPRETHGRIFLEKNSRYST